MTGKKKILVIDDEESMRQLITRWLSSEYTVIEAYDGLSGLSMLETLKEQELPDLIICDLLMPTLTGSEFVASVKQDPKTQKIPLVIITAFQHVSPKAVSLSHQDILTKPFSEEQLKQMVRKKLGSV